MIVLQNGQPDGSGDVINTTAELSNAQHSFFFTELDNQSGRLAFHFANDPNPKFILGLDGTVLNINNSAANIVTEGLLAHNNKGGLNYGSCDQNTYVQTILKDFKSGRSHCKRLLKRMPDNSWIVFEFSKINYNDEVEVLLKVNYRQFCQNAALEALSKAFDFTLTETEVVRHMSNAYCPKEIAFEMDISVNTVRAHLRSIYSKIGVRGYNKALRLILQLSN